MFGGRTVRVWKPLRIVFCGLSVATERPAAMEPPVGALRR